MRKLYLLIFLVLSSGFAYGQTITDTVTIGTGTANQYFYGPIYRSSSGSSFDYSRYSYLFTAGELAAAGIPSGATIKGVAWDKTSTFTTNGGADFDIYAENNGSTSIGSSGTPWTSVIGTATQVYTSTSQTIPAATGWLYFNFGSSFVYTGGSMQISTDWDISGVTGSPATGAFRWRYTPATNLAIGIASSSTGGVANLRSTSYGNNRPNIQIIYEFTPKTDDLAIGARTSPSPGCLGSAETVTVDIANIGLNMATNFQVGFQVTDPVSGTQFPVVETITDTIPSGGSMTYTFSGTADMSTSGTHALATFITYGADKDNSNNGQVDSVKNEKVTAPFIETFEGFALGAGAIPNNGWTDGGGQLPWYGDQGTTSSGSTGPNVDHTFGTSAGTYMYLEASSVGTGSEVRLISPCIDLDTLSCPKLRFWYHMYGAAMGELHVDISTDGGATWTNDIMDPLIGEQHPLTGSPWSEAIVNLGAYNGQGAISLRFRGIDGNSFTGDMAIDDIEIFDGAGEDVAVSAIVEPMTGCVGGTETVTIQITNKGCNTIPANSVAAGFFVTGPNNTGPIAQTIGDSIGIGQTLTFSFTSTANLGTVGAYNVLGTAAFTPTSGITDTDATNNSLSDSVFNTLKTAPWTEDFESFTTGGAAYENGWEDGGGATTWTPDNGGTPSFGTGPSVDHTLGTSAGKYMFIESNNALNGSVYLITPCIDMSALSCPTLKFFYHMYGSATLTGDLHVDLSSDNGVTWTQDILPAIMGRQQTANAAPWDSVEFNMSAYSTAGNIRLRFRGEIKGSSQSDLAIDDVSITNGSGSDVGITEFVSPMSGCGLGMDSVTVEVTNYGCGSVTNVPIGYSVNAGTPVIATVPGPIASGSSVTYTFSTMANLSTVGVYTVGVATGLVGDVDNSNDTIIASVEHSFLPNVPGTSNTVVCYGATATLGATSNGDTILWYDTPGGMPIAFGNNYTTGAITSPDTFYATSAAFATQDLFTGNSNNGASGNMFDIEATGGNVTIDSFYLNNSRTTATDFEIFYKVGSYLGAPESNPAAWTSLGRDTVVANGNNNLTPIPIHLNVTIPIGQTYAFYVHSYNGSMRYVTGTSEGAPWASDNFITIYQGIGTPGLFPTSSNRPRNWSGRVFYTAVGCESDPAMVIADVHPTIMPIDLGADTTVCGRSNIILDAGNTGYNLNYLWSTGSTNQTYTATGTFGQIDTTTYTVTVSDSLGCTASDDITIIALEPIDINAMTTDVDCHGAANGAIDITVAGGVGMLTYAWSNGDSVADLTGLSGGQYVVDVTDTLGCTNSNIFIINEPAAPVSVVLDTLVNVLCFGDSTGGIDITVAGGTMPYTYAWSNGDTTQDLSSLPAGSYMGTITDANGCTLSSATLDVTEPASAVSIAVDGTGDENCAGDNSGYIFITPSGGVGPYTYLWSNGATTPDLNGIPAGDYTGTVTDANGCSLTAGPVTIAVLDSMPTAAFSNVVSGGTVTFSNNSSANSTTYSWDFGDGSPTESGLNPGHIYTANGTYTVTLIAYNGCGSDTTSQTIDLMSVSIDDLLNSNIKVYPNPNNGKFSIEFSRLYLKDVKVQMTSVAGQRIVSENLGNVNGTHSYDVEMPANIAKGVYILSVISEDGTLHKRVMIE